MRFEMYAKYSDEGRMVSLMPHAPNQISDTYKGQGQISVTIMPVNPVEGEDFETVCDFELTEAIALRDALSALIGVVSRYPPQELSND